MEVLGVNGSGAGFGPRDGSWIRDFPATGRAVRATRTLRGIVNGRPVGETGRLPGSAAKRPARPAVPAIGVTYNSDVPSVAFSNRSVIQQWNGMTPLRTRTATATRLIPNRPTDSPRPPAWWIAHPLASSATNNAMWSANGRTGRPRLRSSQSGGRACRATSRIIHHPDRVLNMARASDSESSVQAKGKRRTLVRSVPRIMAKKSKAASGNSGALSSSTTRKSPPIHRDTTSQQS